MGYLTFRGEVLSRFITSDGRIFENEGPGERVPTRNYIVFVVSPNIII
jgi:hypothetical protein